MKRLFKGCAMVLAVLVLVVVAGYVVRGMSGLGEVRAAKRQAVADIEEAVDGADRRAGRHEVAVRRALGLGEPAYRWHELSCDLSTRDAGWIVQSHTQVCQVQAVELHELDDPPVSDCEPVDVPLELTSETGLYVTALRGPSDALSDARPWDHLCPDHLARPSRFDATRRISGQRPGTLDERPGWLVVTTTAPVSETDLGCSPWGVRFCSQPVDDPVLPRA